MNIAYEKPSITKIKTGMMNKFGSNPQYARKIRDNIEGVAIEKLTNTYGSPLFVFSETNIRQKFQQISSAFTTRYPKVTFGWSYKTNYLSSICAIFHQEGAIAEVVSEMEYEKARQLNIPGRKIIFNGPHKSISALKRAVSEGAKINIDHIDEINTLIQIADEMNQTIKVGLRINMDTGITPQWSRFGLNLESGAAIEAVKRMAASGKLILQGLHTHIGTYILEPDAYAKAVAKLLQFADQVKEAFGFTLDYLDLGGGFPSKSKLKGTYHSPEMMVPSIDQYAQKITDALYQHLKPGHFPELILECGRAMVDEAGYLISTITASKRLPDGRKGYIADAGINILYTSYWYKYNIEFDRLVQGPDEPSIIFGPLCMNIDVIEEATMLPALETGTRMTLFPVGAYNVTQWMQFITYRPAVILIGPEKQVDVIREAEELSDIVRREKLPLRLQTNTSKSKQMKAA